MLAPLVLIGALLLVAQHRAADRSSDLGAEVSREVRELDRLTRALAVGEAAAVDAFARRPGGADRYRAGDREIRRVLESMTRVFDEPDEAGLLALAAGEWRGATVAAAIALEGGGPRPYALAPFHPLVAGVNATISQLLDRGLREMTADRASDRRASRQERTVLICVLLAALLGSVLLAQRLQRSMKRPLSELRDGARRLAGGDFYHRVAVSPDDEFAEVARAFNAMADRLIEQALHDELTGLPNRTLLNRRITHALTGGVAALLLDLDDFKAVNDSLGHRAGDVLLCEVGRRLAACASEQDSLARLSGDEFALVLGGADEAAATIVARRVLEELTAAFAVDGREVRVRASIGIATASPGDGVDADDLLRRADVAMYIAKADGSHGYCAFSPDMLAAREREVGLINALQDCADAGFRGFDVHYQPIVATADGAMVGVEALARWTGPAGLPVAPHVFIPLMERTGLVGGLGRWLLERACGDVAHLEAATGHPVSLSVNVSALQLRDPSFVGVVAESLAAGRRPAELLTLELTESMLMEDIEQSVARLGALKQLGVRLAVDDFGTGYSSLARLRGLPLDELKVDRAFVAALATDDADDRVVVRAIATLGHELGLSVVAEGVESERQWHAVDDLGCQRAQGFFFGRPAPMESVATFAAPEPRPIGHDLRGAWPIADGRRPEIVGERQPRDTGRRPLAAHTSMNST